LVENLKILPYPGYAILTTQIRDINDNGPAWGDSGSTQITLVEGTSDRIHPAFDSTEFYICEALDMDSPIYSTQINKYTITKITPCTCDCINEECRLDEENIDFVVGETADQDAPVSCDSTSPYGVIFTVDTEYLNTSLPGLNREKIAFYQISVSVTDQNCLPGVRAECAETLCHGCTEAREKVLYITVEDINDNGPQIMETAKDLTIPAGSEKGYNIPESLKVSDLDSEEQFKSSEAVIVNQELRCASGKCDDAKMYFKIDSSNMPGSDPTFTLQTKENIPAYEDAKFFTEVVLTGLII